VVVLSGGDVCVILDVSDGVPVIRHWGARLSSSDIDDGAVLDDALARPIVGGGLDVETPLSIVPEASRGWLGRPGLAGHRHGGRDWAPRFSPGSVELTADGCGAEITAVDEASKLSLRTFITVTGNGALRLRAMVTNDGERRYLLHDLNIAVPLPSSASELVTYTGRWLREMRPERVSWTHGAWSVENRSGRTSHEHPPVIWACSPGAREWSGRVWGIHLAWSGNHRIAADCLPDGRRVVHAGELLLPGEICLEPGESYSTPEVVAVTCETGFTAASQMFHREVRDRAPAANRPRPVLVNTWEAMYFDHDANRLNELATVAAEVGIERFVLDDGWFGSRRDDTSGLGDWTVSAEAYPDGLEPLITHVRGLGMEFGIWVEPEMVNPDSDLHRLHPEWVLGGANAVLGRHQLVLDLGRDDAYRHIFEQLDALLTDHEISFVKWDMNRPHVAPTTAGGAAGSHAQTLAVHRLIDELRDAHPNVEFESCASGGGRIDHRMLESCHRVWTSDCNDALERQLIHEGASMFVPPEVMGAHIGPPRSHTTGRRQSLAFRAITAMFGHLGVEWDLLSLTDTERATLAEAIALHKRFRPLLHSGDVVRLDVEPNGPLRDALAHGVHAIDRSESLIAYVQLATGMALVPPRLSIPGLDPERTYAVHWLQVGRASGPARTLPAWMTASAEQRPVEMTGRQLQLIGLQPPALWPESAVLVHLDGRHP
jgi:alpha-galactosidase